MNEIEIRRREISEELGIPLDKVIVYPYKAPKDWPDPTPFEVKLKREYEEWAKESGVSIYELGDLCTHDYVYKNPFKGGQSWQTIRRN